MKSLVLIVVLCSIHINVFAECTRDDVNYYLSKGFTTDQVYGLCTTKKDLELNKEHFSSKSNKVESAMLFLKEAILADVSFEESHLSYVVRECIEYDPVPSGVTIRRKKICSPVLTSISYAGMMLPSIDVPQLNLLNKPVVFVKGSIKKTIVASEKLDKMTSYDRRLLNDYLKNIKTSYIPVKDYSIIDRVKENLLIIGSN